MLRGVAKSLVASAFLLAGVAAHAQYVNIVSSGADTDFAYSYNTDYSGPAAPLLAAASAGPNAFVVAPNGAWTGSIPGSSAVWIGDTPDAGNSDGYSAIYAANFSWAGSSSAYLK